jgi:hypothetical protein
VLWPLSYHRCPGMWAMHVTCWQPWCTHRRKFRQCLFVRTTICSLWAVYSASFYLWSCEALFLTRQKYPVYACGGIASCRICLCSGPGHSK